MKNKDLADMRKVHTLGRLLEEDAGENPFDLFRKWLQLAVSENLTEASAFSLSTADKASGRPSSRMMLLKELDDKGFVFYTNYESGKGKTISENPQAAILFFWHTLEKQIRIEGKLEKVTPEETKSYFHIRPRESQIGAHASRQSSVIPDRNYLDNRYAELEKEFADGEIPVPSYWGGYRLLPDMMEFWQGRPSRLHDRIRFRKDGNAWIKERLSP